MSLTDKLQQWVEEFSLFEDAHERLAAVVDKAKRLPPLPDAERTEDHRVPGCVSVVWLVGEFRAGRCFFRSDATSPLVRGLVTFVSSFFNDTPAAEIVATDADPLEALDLLRNLSPTRRNGLVAVRAAILDFARRCG